MAQSYQVGDSVVCFSEWKALTVASLPVVTRALTNPTAISCSVVAPDNTTTAPTPTNVSTGVYYISVLANQAGTWSVTWTGTGAAAGVERQTFTVSSL